MEHEKVRGINPALVDKMLRTEDAVRRGQAEAARRDVLRIDETDGELPPQDSLLGLGGAMVILGAGALFADLLLRDLSLLWLGGLERPVEVMLIVVGAALVAARVAAGVPLSRLWRNRHMHQVLGRRARR